MYTAKTYLALSFLKFEFTSNSFKFVNFNFNLMKKEIHIIYKCGYCGYSLFEIKTNNLQNSQLYSNDEIIEFIKHECPNCHKKFIGKKKIKVSYGF